MRTNEGTPVIVLIQNLYHMQG